MSTDMPTSRKRTRTEKLRESDDPIAKKLRGDKDDNNEKSETSVDTSLKKRPPTVSKSSATGSKQALNRSSSKASTSSQASLHPTPGASQPPKSTKGVTKKAYVVEDESDDESSESSEGSDIPGLDDVEDDNPVELDAPDDAEEDAGAELERLMGTWNSPAYAFFKPRPQIEESEKGRYHVFECGAQHCKSRGSGGRFVKRNTRTGDRSSTKNLIRHASRCYGEEVVKAALSAGSLPAAREVLKKSSGGLKDGSILTAFKREGKGSVTYLHRMLDPLESRAEHVRWVCKCKRPFNMVKDEPYHRLMKSGRAHQYIPSPTTVSRDVKAVFVRSREKIAKVLREQDGQLSFATDAWTTPNNRALIAFTVHFEENGEAKSLLLDLIELATNHTGENLAAAFSRVLEEFGIDDKVLCVTCDNASANDTMTDNLEELLPDYPGEAGRARCFCHVINLVVKSVLAQFDIPKKKKKAKKTVRKARKGKKRPKKDDWDNVPPDDDSEWEDIEVDVEEIADPELAVVGEFLDREEELTRESDYIHDDETTKDVEDGYVDEREEMSEEERTALDETMRPARQVLAKLRKIAYSVKNSSTILRPRWNAACKTANLKPKTMPRDVRTRWNSTYDMVKFASKYRKAIQALTNDIDSGLRAYEMVANEWEMVSELVKVLKTFKHATTYFSRKNTPNITNVIPAMDHIEDVLATAVITNSYSIPVKKALEIGRRTLNRYYSKTDHSEVYRISMVLNPCHKLAYFRDAGWEESWIEIARDLTRSAFERYKKLDFLYEVVGEAETDKETEAAESDNDDGDGDSNDGNMFDQLFSQSRKKVNSNRDDELEVYLSSEREQPEDVGDLHKWWHKRRDRFPCLARMALDYLTIPATSVDVERVFSQGRILFSHLRNRLEAETARAIMCVGDWCEKGFLTEKELEAALRGLPELNEKDGEPELDRNWDRIPRK